MFLDFRPLLCTCVLSLLSNRRTTKCSLMMMTMMTCRVTYSVWCIASSHFAALTNRLSNHAGGHRSICRQTFSV